MAKRIAAPNINDKRKRSQPVGSMRKNAKHYPAAY